MKLELEGHEILEGFMGAGRPSLGLVMVKVGLPEGLLRRLEEEGVNRSEWVREACEMRLSGEKSVVEACAVRPVVPRRSGKRDWTGDFPAVEAAIVEHRYSARELARRFGWSEMKVDKVLAAMASAGRIRFERGVVVLA